MMRENRNLARMIVLIVLLGSAAAPAASAQFIYVANAGDDTLSKIDIVQEKEVARYRTWFGPGSPNHVPHLGNPWGGPAPSRVAIDVAGNVYVLNRFFTNHLPVLLKINPSGGGATSTGPTPLPLIDANNDNHITKTSPSDTSEVKDTRIEWAIEIGQPGHYNSGGDAAGVGRSLCIDLSGNLWVGVHHSMRYYKIDPVTLQQSGPYSTDTPNLDHRPYGCVVDSNGILYSASNNTTIAVIDTTDPTPTAAVHDHTSSGWNYGISIMNHCGADSRLYLSERSPSPSGKTYITYDPVNGFANANVTAPYKFTSYAIGIDQDDNIVSGDTKGRIVKWDAAGTLLWDTSAPVPNSTLATNDMHGVILDENDDVWAVHLLAPSNNQLPGKVVKYSGVDGTKRAEVFVGNSPYTYSNPPPPNCPCARIDENPISCQGQNGGVGTYSWSYTFTNQNPFGTPATSVDLSSSDPNVTILTPSPSTGIQLSPAVPHNGQGTLSGTFSVANAKPGDRVCLDMRLYGGGSSGWCCPDQRVCFKLPECRQCADVKGQFKCNQSGQQYLELTIVNNGPTTAQGFQVFSTTPGVMVTPSSTQVALPPGTPVAVPVTVTGASAGQAINLTVNIHGPSDPKTGVYSWCCTSSFRVVRPVQQDCPIVVNPDGDIQH